MGNFEIELTAQGKAILLLVGGFFLWFIPLRAGVDPLLQLLCFAGSAGCFITVILTGDDIRHEEKSIRQQRMQRDYLQAARFEFEEKAEEVQLERRILAPVQSAPAAAQPLPGTNDAIAHAGEVLAKVLEHCGDAAIELIDYLWDGKAESISDDDGWINVRQLRQNWGRHHGYNAETFTGLLQKLADLKVGEFHDSECKEWRLLLVV